MGCCMWIQSNTCLCAAFSDLLEGTMQMRASFVMYSYYIGTSFAESFNVFFGFNHHQMHIQYFVGQSVNGLNHRHSKGKIWNKTTIHYVDMNPVGRTFI